MYRLCRIILLSLSKAPPFVLHLSACLIFVIWPGKNSSTIFCTGCEKYSYLYHRYAKELRNKFHFFDLCGCCYRFINPGILFWTCLPRRGNCCLICSNILLLSGHFLMNRLVSLVDNRLIEYCYPLILILKIYKQVMLYNYFSSMIIIIE